MPKWFLILIGISSLSVALLTHARMASADETIRLKNGKIYEGDILFWNDTQVAVSVDGKALCVDIADVEGMPLKSRTNFTHRSKK
jgi:hypothetical protein